MLRPTVTQVRHFTAIHKTLLFPDKSKLDSYRKATMRDNSKEERDTDDEPNSFVIDDNTYWWERDNSETEEITDAEKIFLQLHYATQLRQ